MTIGIITPVKDKGSMKKKQVVDERDPLLPNNRNGEDGFHEFNRASYSGAVFNLSTTIVGAGIMALPATPQCAAYGDLQCAALNNRCAASQIAQSLQHQEIFMNIFQETSFFGAFGISLSISNFYPVLAFTEPPLFSTLYHLLYHQ